jgi:hypothetical protein
MMESSRAMASAVFAIAMLRTASAAGRRCVEGDSSGVPLGRPVYSYQRRLK